jgi:PKD repeat protein
MKNKLLLLIAAIGLMSCGGGGGGGGSGSSQPSNSATISSSGGTINDPVSGAILSIPAESLMTSSANVSVTASTPSSTIVPIEGKGSATILSKVFTLKKDVAFDFVKPIEVTLPYNTVGLTNNDRVEVAYFSTTLQKWIPISSNVVDNRAAGVVKFDTAHFSDWSVISRSFNEGSPMVSIDYGYQSVIDGIPFANFGAAITPDGNTTYENGSCAGMAVLSGWYFKYKKSTEGAAVSYLTDDVKWNTRAFVAAVHSATRKFADDNSKSKLNGIYTLDPSAPRKLWNELNKNASPVAVWVLSSSGKGHYVLVHKYDALAKKFYYYDSDYPLLEKNFDINALGFISNWNLKKSSTETSNVTRFSVLPVISEFISHETLSSAFAEYKQAKITNTSFYSSPTWGKIDNLAVNNVTSLSGDVLYQITGSVAKPSVLSGKYLYVHVYAPQNKFVPFAGPPDPRDEIEVGIRRTMQYNNQIYNVYQILADGTFKFDVLKSQFVTSSSTDLRLYVSTNAGTPWGGAWAYSQVKLIPTANTAPTAIITPAAGPYLAGAPIIFSGASSTDAEGAITSYAWAFGDGGTAAGVSPAHTYSAAGTYTVTLTVTDAGGLSNSATRSVSVSAAPSVNSGTFCTSPVVGLAFSETFINNLNPNVWITDTSGGTIDAGSGKASFRSNGNSSRFPYAQTIQNPFPASGNYSFYCKASYLNIGSYGAGACAATQNVLAPGSSFTTYNLGTAYSWWADNGQHYSGQHYSVSTSNNNILFTKDISQNTGEFELETCVIGSNITTYKNGVQIGVGILPLNQPRPTKIWMGNPTSDGDTNGLWSIFDTSKIEVRILQ